MVEKHRRLTSGEHKRMLLAICREDWPYSLSPIFVRNAPSNVVVAMKPESESTYDKSTTTNVFKETM